MSGVGTLAERLLPQRGILENSLVRKGVLVVAGSLFVALCAQIRIPLAPFSPVPITGQTLGVLLVGSLLGPQLGLLALLLYLVEGLVGLPVYTGGASGIEILYGATGGYLVAFPLAALLTGWLAERGWDRRVLTTIAAMVLGNLVIYTLGVAWLSTKIGLIDALGKGMLPFLIGDALKIAVAVAVLPGGWALLNRKK